MNIIFVLGWNENTPKEANVCHIPFNKHINNRNSINGNGNNDKKINNIILPVVDNKKLQKQYNNFPYITYSKY